MSKAPAPPPWGEAIRKRREQAGLTIREAGRKSGLSDSFWGQVEKGYQARPSGNRTFVPAIGVLLQIGRGLRMTDAETDELIALAGYDPLPERPSERGGAGEVDTSGLDRSDVRLLNAMAERLRRP